jgi:initiation factor 1A
MVKNTSGGGKSKKIARKHIVSNNTELVGLEEGESYGIVKEMKGGCECIVEVDGVDMRCKIGGKFRGRNKRNNWIEKGTLLKVGERSWEEGRVDVIYVYDNDEKERIREEGKIKCEEEDEEGGGVEIEFRKGGEKEVKESEVIGETIKRTGGGEGTISIDDI